MRTHTVGRPDGPDLHLAETGPRDGEPLLFVHGYSQNLRCWREQLDSGLAGEFRLLAMDLRGHGASETPAGGYDDGAEWAGDVRAVLEGLELTDVVLVGWSYGSLVVLDYLAAHGTDRVAGLNLVGVVCGVGTPATDEWLQEPYLELFPDIVSTDAATSVAALERFVDLCVHGELPVDDRYRVLGYNAVVPPFVRDGMRDRTVSHLDLLPELSVPALLSHGEHDDVVGIEASRTAVDRLPDATVSSYPACGHSPFLEAPERFNRELREFVDGLG